MTYLYPRLLSGRAQGLFEKYAAASSLADMTANAATHDDSAVFVATGGARVSRESLSDLASSVRRLAGRYGFPSNRRLATEFDVELAKLLHESMEIAPAEAASRDVWAFLSLVLLPDVAYWRFPTPPGDRVLNTDITRHVFGRLWWRAELVHDPALTDPYDALMILGEADFDHVYARRAQIGASPKIVRNLLLVWRQLRTDGALADTNDREAFRANLVQLNRVVPFLSLNALDDEALAGELRRTALQAISTVQNQPDPDGPTVEARSTSHGR
jgi:hypothetical protein